jgi:deoxyribonuclease V
MHHNCLMDLQHTHSWDVTTAEAREIQRQLRDALITSDRIDEVGYVAGVDVGFDKRGGRTRAAVSVLSFPALDPVEDSVVYIPTRFPYVPGLLSFREIPAIVEALQQLRQLPDLILCDGQGYAHPRRFGLACHLGVITGLPTIGVAKSRLLGEHDEPPQERGAWTAMIHQDEVVGAVLRTRVNVKPVYVSIGHRVSLATSCDYTMSCVTRYRLPETTRRADRLASRRGQSK